MPGSSNPTACLSSVVSRLCGSSDGSSTSAVDTKSNNTASVCADAPNTFQGKPFPYSGMTALTQQDLECISQRHLYRKPSAAGVPDTLGRQVVGAGKRCRHGWPQAILYDPLYKESEAKSYRLGDTTRLTCPLLVTAIDKLEKGGAMERYNERLAPSADWEKELPAVNEAHRLLRLELIGDRQEELAEVKNLLGTEAFAIAMRSGLASLRPEAKPDVKCLHAQVADELVRDGNNKIAQQVLKDIEDQGIPVYGSDECCDNCNVGLPLEFSRWRLHKCKNNVGKRLSRGRKQEAASRAGTLAGDINDERRGEEL